MVDLTPILTHQTNGINYDVTTEDVITQLRQWDDQYGIDISEITHDGVKVVFHQLPEDPDTLMALAQEIYDFCPDVIDQGLGCIDDFLDFTPGFIPTEIQALMEGVDLSDPDYGLTVLVNSLRLDRTLQLWWD